MNQKNIENKVMKNSKEMLQRVFTNGADEEKCVKTKLNHKLEAVAKRFGSDDLSMNKQSHS